MKIEGFWKRLLRFLRNALIMLWINLVIGYLIVRMTISYTPESQGRIMIILGCLYMLVGVGSLAGRSKFRYETPNFNIKAISEYHANQILKVDKDITFTLHGAFVGAITLIIGLMMYGH